MPQNNKIEIDIIKIISDSHRDFRKSFFAFDEQNTIFEDNSRDHKIYSRLYLLKIIFNPNEHDFQKAYAKDIEKIDCIISRFPLLNNDERNQLTEEAAKEISLIYVQEIKDEIDKDYGKNSIQIRVDAPNDLKEESKAKIKSVINQITQKTKNENNSKIESRANHVSGMVELFKSFRRWQLERDCNSFSSNSSSSNTILKKVSSIAGSSNELPGSKGNRGDLPSASPSCGDSSIFTLSSSSSSELML